MEFRTLSGGLKQLNVSKYRIDWAAKEKSNPQTVVKNFLYLYWNRDLVFSEFPVFGTKLRIDIFNKSKMLAVEVDGRQHEDYVKHFHGNRLGYLKSINKDERKETWCEKNKIVLCRIKTSEVKDLTLEWFEDKFGVTLY